MHFINLPVYESITLLRCRENKYSIAKEFFFMTYNISGRKQNLTLQRCNCTPYLKRDIDIPANCTIISEKTFQNRSMIQSVSFPYGLKQIGSNAFSGCSRLKHLLLPESLCQIGKEAFSDCTSLSSIYIPQYISTISKGMLRNAHKLSETLFSSESRLLLSLIHI